MKKTTDTTARFRYRPLMWLFVIALAALLAALGTEFFRGQGLDILAALLLFAVAVLLLFIAVRIIRFHTRIFRLLRRLVAGDYESALTISRRWKDEISVLEDLFNKLTEQLRQYDELRTRRIRQLRMTLDLVLQHTTEPMALYDVEKDNIELNAAMTGVLDTAKATVQLSALRNLEKNTDFVNTLHQAVEEEKSHQEARVAIQLPGQESFNVSDIRVIPYKEKDGTVSLAIIFGKPVEG